MKQRKKKLNKCSHCGLSGHHKSTYKNIIILQLDEEIRIQKLYKNQLPGFVIMNLIDFLLGGFNRAYIFYHG
jgi:hypothetical protein